MSTIREFRTDWRNWIDTPVRWTGLAAGVVVNNLVTFSPESDVDLLYAIPVLGICAVGGVLLADVVAHPAARGVRQASAAPRRIRDHVPRGLSSTLLVQALLLVVLLVVAVATASTDATGHAGRAVAVACDGRDQLVGPWPGPYYAWPVLGGLAVGTVVCAATLRRITMRAADDERRRIRARATVGAWGLLTAAPLFAVSLTMATAMLSLSCGGWMETVSFWALGIVAFVSVLTAGWCLSALLLPQAYIKERP
ncbi:MULTISPECIES: hypothetical protein [unclassified Streptomyces]|uniref:hypothetical protein n=1 Tax=unclassified Streptomyces TaxID=2593676 RepID=UPI002E2DD83F|nr:hypothetical protein [Streptomyces sp. NBC_00306]